MVFYAQDTFNRANTSGPLLSTAAGVQPAGIGAADVTDLTTGHTTPGALPWQTFGLVEDPDDFYQLAIRDHVAILQFSFGAISSRQYALFANCLSGDQELAVTMDPKTRAVEVPLMGPIFRIADPLNYWFGVWSIQDPTHGAVYLAKLVAGALVLVTSAAIWEDDMTVPVTLVVKCAADHIDLYDEFGVHILGVVDPFNATAPGAGGHFLSANLPLLGGFRGITIRPVGPPKLAGRLFAQVIA